ncbi:uncharacterized protein AB675_2856 [Cyphellophora attinorum]|uniref:Uncharacterized protein n=1 Tax=Cyphellophora attinorum TaxID=1664694 RepID=A0A0N1P465_9EURO|nr:uncharacterized protein AB675_2856 [Phialophora attinorum]KPI45123.1 hypothetical protein AB675_2856 [Phialophora attinorum]
MWRSDPNATPSDSRVPSTPQQAQAQNTHGFTPNKPSPLAHLAFSSDDPDFDLSPMTNANLSADLSIDSSFLNWPDDNPANWPQSDDLDDMFGPLSASPPKGPRFGELGDSNMPMDSSNSIYPLIPDNPADLLTDRSLNASASPSLQSQGVDGQTQHGDNLHHVSSRQLAKRMSLPAGFFARRAISDSVAQGSTATRSKARASSMTTERPSLTRTAAAPGVSRMSGHPPRVGKQRASSASYKLRPPPEWLPEPSSPLPPAVPPNSIAGSPSEGASDGIKTKHRPFTLTCNLCKLPFRPSAHTIRPDAERRAYCAECIRSTGDRIVEEQKIKLVDDDDEYMVFGSDPLDAEMDVFSSQGNAPRGGLRRFTTVTPTAHRYNLRSSSGDSSTTAGPRRKAHDQYGQDTIDMHGDTVSNRIAAPPPTPEHPSPMQPALPVLSDAELAALLQNAIRDTPSMEDKASKPAANTIDSQRNDDALFGGFTTTDELDGPGPAIVDEMQPPISLLSSYTLPQQIIAPLLLNSGQASGQGAPTEQQSLSQPASVSSSSSHIHARTAPVIASLTATAAAPAAPQITSPSIRQGNTSRVGLAAAQEFVRRNALDIRRIRERMGLIPRSPSHGQGRP